MPRRDQFVDGIDPRRQRLSPTADLDTVLNETMKALTKRLNMTLG